MPWFITSKPPISNIESVGMQAHTQNRRPRRRQPFLSSTLGFGALCFIALLPFLLFQQDEYEQRRFLSAASYQEHASHPYVKGFRRSNRRKGNLTKVTRLRNTTQRNIIQSPRDEHDCLVVFHLPCSASLTPYLLLPRRRRKLAILCRVH